MGWTALKKSQPI